MEEKRERKDRRVAKTHKAIRNAFVQLMVEKDFERITVKEIAERADVDRKTVYNYYNGIHEIREELENELVSLFEKATADLDYSIENPYVCFDALTKLLMDNMELYGQLMKLDSRSQLVVGITAYLQKKIRKAIDSSGLVPPEKQALAAEFTATGMFTVYKSWFASDRKQSLTEFSKDVSNLVLHGLFSFLDTPTH